MWVKQCITVELQCITLLYNELHYITLELSGDVGCGGHLTLLSSWRHYWGLRPPPPSLQQIHGYDGDGDGDDTDDNDEYKYNHHHCYETIDDPIENISPSKSLLCGLFTRLSVRHSSLSGQLFRTRCQVAPAAKSQKSYDVKVSDFFQRRLSSVLKFVGVGVGV